MKAEDYAYGSCHKQRINLQASFDVLEEPYSVSCSTTPTSFHDK